MHQQTGEQANGGNETNDANKQAKWGTNEWRASELRANVGMLAQLRGQSEDKVLFPPPGSGGSSSSETTRRYRAFLVMLMQTIAP